MIYVIIILRHMLSAIDTGFAIYTDNDLIN